MSTDQRFNGLEPSLIGTGATLGTPVRLGGYALIALVLDAAWDQNAITFQTSLDLDLEHETEATWYDIYFDDTDAELTIPSAVAKPSRALAMHLVLNKLGAFNWIRPRSGTAVAPVAQGDDTLLTFIVKA
jgi:hypothetical protein